MAFWLTIATLLATYLVATLISRLFAATATKGAGAAAILTVAFLADSFLPALLASFSLQAGHVNS